MLDLRRREWLQCATRHAGIGHVQEYEFCLCPGRLYFRGTCGTSAFRKVYKVLTYYSVSDTEIRVQVFDEKYEERHTMTLSRVMEIVWHG